MDVDKLNGKTPKWFRDWHNDHYIPGTKGLIRDMKRNEKFIYLIIAAIVGSAVVNEVDSSIIETILHMVGS